MVVEPTLSFYYLAFNLLDPVLGKNRALRQAFSEALDHPHWILTFTGGAGRAMNTVLGPGVLDSASRLSGNQSAPGARLKTVAELLAKAGHPGGKGLPPFQLDMRGSDEFNHEFAERYAKDLAQVGVRLAVTYNSFEDYLEKAKAGKLQISYGGWALDYPDPVNGLQLLYGPNHAPGPNEEFQLAEFNRLHEQLQFMDPVPRAKRGPRMEEIVVQEVPALGYVPYDYRSTIRGQSGLIHPRIEVFRFDPGIRFHPRPDRNGNPGASEVGSGRPAHASLRFHEG